VPANGPWDGAGDGFVVYPSLASFAGIARVFADLRPSARAIGELAMPLLENGQGVPASEALPLYVRHRVALTTAERNAGVRL
jgi:tRNA threonylcarbamoyladenosine biosynthesis protein TsaB